LWVIAVLASLAVLLLLALCVPLNTVVHADMYGKPKVRLRLSWLFGLVSKEITGEKEKPAEKKRAGKAKKKRWRVDTRIISRILSTKGLLRQLIELLKGVFSCFKFRDLVADLKIGLGDPADTGLLFAIIGPATAVFGSSHRHQIRLEPSFGDDAILQGYSHGKIRLHPVRLVPPLMKFTFSITTIKAVKTLILSKWKRKK
jgi:hypothetical protein